jgi:hypothetical protein
LPERVRPNSWLERIEAIADEVGARSLIDYGCGTSRGVSRFSRLQVSDYDPGVPGCETIPARVDMVVSVHALEHVEPEHVDAVIAHIRSLARAAALLVISCDPSTKVLPDGSPWHSLVRDPDWWRDRLCGWAELQTSRPQREFAAMWRA